MPFQTGATLWNCGVSNYTLQSRTNLEPGPLWNKPFKLAVLLETHIMYCIFILYLVHTVCILSNNCVFSDLIFCCSLLVIFFFMRKAVSVAFAFSITLFIRVKTGSKMLSTNSLFVIPAAVLHIYYIRMFSPHYVCHDFDWFAKVLFISIIL